MLVLSRKTGEEILVGDDVVITITEIQGGKVRVGIKAPRHVKVMRAELKNRPSAPPRKGNRKAK